MDVTIALFAVFALLQVADYWTTQTFLSMGVQERNRVIIWLMWRFGRLGGLVVAKALPRSSRHRSPSSSSVR